MTLAFSVAMAGLVSEHQRGVMADTTSTRRLNVEYIDKDTGNRTTSAFDVQYTYTSSLLDWEDEIGVSRMNVEWLNEYAINGVTTKRLSGVDYTITSVSNSDIFKRTFGKGKWTISQLYYNESTVYTTGIVPFDAWTWIGEDKVRVCFTDEFGIHWKTNKWEVDVNDLLRDKRVILGKFSGTGTTTGEIDGSDALIELRDNVNNVYNMDYDGCTLKLTKDIDLGGSYWTPIGYKILNGTDWTYHAFRGIFDGNGHAISNMSIKYVFNGRNDLMTPYDDKEEAVGLFSKISDATIKNLLMTDASISLGGGPLYDGYKYAYSTDAVGILVGAAGNTSTIENCQVLRSTISAQDDADGGSQYAGGLVGLAYQGTVTIDNCAVQADISVACNSRNETIHVYVGAGGIFGFCFNADQAILKDIRVTIKNSYYVGMIEAFDRNTSDKKNKVECVSVGGIASGMATYTGEVLSIGAVYGIPTHIGFAEKEDLQKLVQIKYCFSYIYKSERADGNVCPAYWSIDNNRSTETDWVGNYKETDPYHTPGSGPWLQGASFDAIAGGAYYDPNMLYNNTIIQGAEVSNSYGFFESGIQEGKLNLYTGSNTQELLPVKMESTEYLSPKDAVDKLCAQWVYIGTYNTKHAGEIYDNLRWSINLMPTQQGNTSVNTTWYLPRVGDIHFWKGGTGLLRSNDKRELSTFYGLPIIRKFVSFTEYEAEEGDGVVKDSAVFLQNGDVGVNTITMLDDTPDNKTYKFGKLDVVEEAGDNVYRFYAYKLKADPDMNNGYGGAVTWTRGSNANRYKIQATFDRDPPDLRFSIRDITETGDAEAEREELGMFVPSWKYDVSDQPSGVKLTTTKVDNNNKGSLSYDSIDIQEYLLYRNVPQANKDGTLRQLTFNSKSDNKSVIFTWCKYDETTGEFQGYYEQITITLEIDSDSVYEFAGWAVYSTEYNSEGELVGDALLPSKGVYASGIKSLSINTNYVIRAMIRLKTGYVDIECDDVGSNEVVGSSLDYLLNKEVVSSATIRTDNQLYRSDLKINPAGKCEYLLPEGTTIARYDDGFEILTPYSIALEGGSTYGTKHFIEFNINKGFALLDIPHVYKSGSQWFNMPNDTADLITINTRYMEEPCQILYAVNAITYNATFGWTAISETSEDLGGSFTTSFTVKNEINFKSEGFTDYVNSYGSTYLTHIQTALNSNNKGHLSISDWVSDYQKSFGGWYVRTKNSGGTGYTIYNSEGSSLNYKAKYENSSDYLEIMPTVSGFDINVKLRLNGDQRTFVDLDGYTCFYIVGIEKGSYGDISEILQLRWANTYDVTIKASVDNPQWGLDKYSTEFKNSMIGIRSWGQMDENGNPIITQTSNDEITMRVADSALEYQYTFYTNAGRAFLKPGNINGTKLENVFGELALGGNTEYLAGQAGSGTDDGNYYALYNYGYEISEWYIVFSYKGEDNFLLLKIESVDGENQPVWSTTQNAQGNDYTLFEKKNGVTMITLATYAEKLDDWFTTFGGVHHCSITMWPVWKPVAIDVRQSIGDAGESKSLTRTSGNHMVYGGEFTVLDIHLQDKEPNKIASYLKVNGDNNNVIYLSQMRSYSYLYTNIASGAYVLTQPEGIDHYNTDGVAYYLYKDSAGGTYTSTYSHIYTLTTKLYSTSNINRIMLNGIEDGDNIVLNDYIEAVSEDVQKYGNDLYNVFTYKNPELILYIDYMWTEGDELLDMSDCDRYAEYIKARVSKYDQYINAPDVKNDESGVLRKLFQVDGKYYIYLAEGKSTGKLPEFTREYYTHIATATSGTAQQLYAYLTQEYDLDIHNNMLNYTNKDGKQKNYSLFDFGFGEWSFIYHLSAPRQAAYEMSVIWYRKSYYYDVSIRESGVNGQYGYVVMTIEDTMRRNPTFYYLVMFDQTDSTMKYYRFDTKPEGEISKIIKPIPTDYLVVQAGSDVTFNIFDQHNDYSLDSFIGHRYTALNMSYNTNSTSLDQDTFEYTFDDELFEHNWKVADNEHVTVVVNYELIKYDLIVKLDDKKAGTLSKGGTTGELSNLTQMTLTDLTIGDWVTITYSATAGYEFQDNAFEFYVDGNKLVGTLKSYANVKADPKKQQTYKLEITGEWLRKYLYESTDRDIISGENKYATHDIRRVQHGNEIEDYGAGLLQVNTKLVEFKIYAKLIDTYNPYDIKEVDQNQICLDASWTLDDKVVDLSGLFKNISNTTDVAYGYISKDGLKYAIIRSYAYDPIRNSTKLAAQTYSYPAKVKPVNCKEIHISDPECIGAIVGTGQIVSDSNRTLYMVVELRQIAELTVTITRGEHDTMVSEPTVKLTASQSTSDGDLSGFSNEITAPSHANAEVVVLGYRGLKLNITTIYDELHYNGATKKFNNYKLTTESVTLTYDSSLDVQFTPKQLAPKLTFYLDDEPHVGSFDSVRELLSDALQQFIIEDNIETGLPRYYVGHTLKFTYLTTAIYNIAIEINSGDNKEVVTCENGTANYTVSDTTYTNGGLNINVILTMVDYNTIRFAYSLGESLSGDNYGGMTGKVSIDKNLDGAIKEEDGEITLYSYDELKTGIIVVKGSTVEISFEENYGYEVLSYQLNGGTVVFVTAEQSSLPIQIYQDRLCIPSYNNDNMGGVCTINLKKSTYTATLAKSDNSVNNKYNFKTDKNAGVKQNGVGVAVLSSVQVGQIITFAPDDVYDKTEKLGKYYYILNGVETEIHLTDVNKKEAKLTITSEFLKKYITSNGTNVLEFYVSSTARYTVSVDYSAAEDFVFFDSHPANTDSNGLVYFDEGDTMTLTFTPKTPEKYSMTITGFDGGDITAINTVEKTITLTRNYDIMVVYGFVNYRVTQEDYRHDTLEDIANGGHLQSSTESLRVQYATVSGELNYVYEKDRSRLTSIMMTGNDLPDIKLEINDKIDYDIIFAGENIELSLVESTITYNEVDYRIKLTDEALTITRLIDVLDSNGVIQQQELTTTIKIARNADGGLTITTTVHNNLTVKSYYTALKTVTSEIRKEGE